MKRFLVLSLGLISAAAIAVPVDGEIFYKLPDGKMAVREVVLDVPSKGQGDVTLTGKNFEWKTKKFKSIKTFGESKFNIVFDVEFNNEKSRQIFKGTYFKTSDHIKYYGSLYKKKGKDFSYIGGFEFNYPR